MTRYRFDARPLHRRPWSFGTKLVASVLASLVLWTPALVYAQDPDGEYADYGQAYEYEGSAYDDPGVTELHQDLGDVEAMADPEAVPIGELDVDPNTLPLDGADFVAQVVPCLVDVAFGDELVEFHLDDCSPSGRGGADLIHFINSLNRRLQDIHHELVDFEGRSTGPSANDERYTRSHLRIFAT